MNARKFRKPTAFQEPDVELVHKRHVFQPYVLNKPNVILRHTNQDQKVEPVITNKFQIVPTQDCESQKLLAKMNRKYRKGTSIKGLKENRVKRVNISSNVHKYEYTKLPLNIVKSPTSYFSSNRTSSKSRSRSRTCSLSRHKRRHSSNMLTSSSFSRRNHALQATRMLN